MSISGNQTDCEGDTCCDRRHSAGEGSFGKKLSHGTVDKEKKFLL
ncbi:MAG: hypothetical protein V3U97_05935 [bacterium]